MAPKRSSTYRGVTWDKGRWRVNIRVNGRIQSLGCFDNEKETARAYDEKAKQLHVNPIVNFLPNGSPNPDRKYVELRHQQLMSWLRFLSNHV